MENKVLSFNQCGDGLYCGSFPQCGNSCGRCPVFEEQEIIGYVGGYYYALYYWPVLDWSVCVPLK